MLPVDERGLVAVVATNAVPEVDVMARAAPTVVQKAVAEVSVMRDREREPAFPATVVGVSKGVGYKCNGKRFAYVTRPGCVSSPSLPSPQCTARPQPSRAQNIKHRGAPRREDSDGRMRVFFCPHLAFFLTCSQHLNFSTDYRDRLQNVLKVRHLNKNGS